jgi:hypothetical protein
MDINLNKISILICFLQVYLIDDTTQFLSVYSWGVLIELEAETANRTEVFDPLFSVHKCGTFQ